MQKSALLVLLRKKTATLQELRPGDVEANVFSYHLEKLQTDEYVVKVGRGTYTLTAKGERFVGAFSTATNRQHEFIKSVIVLYSKTTDGRYLLFRWSRQPYIDRVGLLHDHVALGKSLIDGVSSAMEDKLGVKLEPHYLMTALIKIMHDDELVTHMNALVYEVDVSDVALPFTSRNGTAFLGRIEETPGIMIGLGALLESVGKTVEPQEYILSY